MSTDAIEIQYNEDLKPLEKLLAGVRRTGDFQVHGTVEMPMPRVEIDGVGVLSFPVPENQAKALIRSAVQAPYGRGAKTLVDPKVRRVWLIRHAGREATVDLAGVENSEVGFVAFYADCEHEVRPITAGHRVCLVFNLMQSSDSAGRKSRPLQAPDYAEATQAAAALLQAAFSDPEAPVKIAWLLEHQYSPDGLAFAALKSADRARTAVLLKAAERAGCVAHLGIVHLEEYGSAEPSFEPRSRRRGRWYDEDDAADHESSSGNFAVVEVCDSSQWVDQWRDAQDQPVAFGKIPLKPGELLPAGALNEVPPDRQRLTEATGNEGASFERSYHRAAVVIWRRDLYANVLLQSGAGAALPLLKQKLTPAKGRVLTPPARQAAADLASRILAVWPAPYPYPSRRTDEVAGFRPVMLELLVQLGEVGLIEDFVARIVQVEFDGRENRALIKATRLLGPEKTGTLLAILMSQHAAHWPGESIKLMKALANSLESKPNPAWSKAFRDMAAALIAGLTQVGQDPSISRWNVWNEPEPGSVVDSAGAATLLQTLDAAGAGDLAETATREFLRRPEQFDPLSLLAPALSILGKLKGKGTARVASFGPLWAGTVEFLLQRSEQPPVAPQDWRQTVKLTANVRSAAKCRHLCSTPWHPFIGFESARNGATIWRVRSRRTAWR